VALGMTLCYASHPPVSSLDRERARALAREGHQILSELDARPELAEAKIYAYLAEVAEDEAHAERLLQESIELAREADRPHTEGWALDLLGALCFGQALVDGVLDGEAWQRAGKAFSRALEIFRRAGYRLREAIMIGTMGHYAYGERQYAKARSLYEESLAMFCELGVQEWVLYRLGQLGRVALTIGDHSTAASYFRQHLDKAEAWGNPVEARYALCCLGEVAAAEGELRKAVSLSWRALKGEVEEVGPGAGRILLSMAKLSANVGERVRATEILACAYQNVELVNRPVLELLGGRALREELQRGLSPEVYAAAQERGRARDVEATLRQLLAELEEDLLSS
jgi:tetratricopeptide (TPR) repeat protein